jgi:hypothetical protein
MSNSPICAVNVDAPDGCIGGIGTDDVIYWSIVEQPGGFYVSTLIDSETGHFVEPGVTDDGPHLTWNEANEAGKDHAMEWCYANDLSPE